MPSLVVGQAKRCHVLVWVEQDSGSFVGRRLQSKQRRCSTVIPLVIDQQHNHRLHASPGYSETTSFSYGEDAFLDSVPVGSETWNRLAVITFPSFRLFPLLLIRMSRSATSPLK